MKAPLSICAGLSFGALGFPLAFVALPLYVSLPAHYAREFGVPLAALGALLLGVRLLDALIDPWIGRFSDRWLQRSNQQVLALMWAAALLLAASFAALFQPPVRAPTALLVWCAACLTLSYLAYSLLSVLHQAWGARLGGNALQQTRVVAWREGLGLVGVLCASVLASEAGMGLTAAALAGALMLALVLLSRAPRASGAAFDAASNTAQPFAEPGFVRLLAVFLLNGIAAAVPATLLLFFVRDRLQTPQAESLYLLSYFAAAALSLPVWLRLVAAWGQARAWLAGMLLAVLCFAWAAALNAGDVLGFALVCVGSGAAVGADLAIPGAMLTRVIQQAGLAGRAEGAFFGWWNFASKLNLALAAGLALPLLQWLGYRPGLQDAQALQALALAYCVLPCLLKLGAAVLLYLLWIRPASAQEPA
jgi:GPH family glycoside/pentoside/hexuronide:cation symporter